MSLSSLTNEMELSFILDHGRPTLYSVECARSLLSEFFSRMNDEWIRSRGFKEGTIIRIQTGCIIDCELGSSTSSSFLSNLSANRNYLPATERVLFASRDESRCVLGYGCCKRAESLEEVRFLSSNMSSKTMFVGGDAFDQSDSTKCKGWIIPLVEITSELLESERGSESGGKPFKSQGQSSTSSSPAFSLAVNFIISTSRYPMDFLSEQIKRATSLLDNIQWDFRCRASPLCHLPAMISDMVDTGMSEESYLSAVDDSIAEMKRGNLQKVVYALRKTGTTSSPIDPASLLQAVANENRADQGKRYTFLFAPYGLLDEVFISLSPELFCRVSGCGITTEALAGTFPREYVDGGGTVLDDKISREHRAVSTFISEKLSALGGDVSIDRKELLQMKDVVHYRQVLSTSSANTELSGVSLVAWAASTLHPTPAVCGLPIHTALQNILSKENFRRGLYASYNGIIGRHTGELLVGLRSAVVNKCAVHVYAGAGLVVGSVPAAEWSEISLKMSQYVRVLRSVKRPAMSREFPNATAAVAAAVIEEMIRQGVGAFCVCPGARSTPFAVAIYRHTAARAMTQVVHDERAAGFYAVGCARAGVLCAVLVTSGTAVSNLLPAVSEARESALPMVLITADRPSESRDVGEAQTIRQVGVFSTVVEYEKDFPPSCSTTPQLSAYLMNSVLADVSFSIGEIAVRRGQRVHLNFQFRKPELDPTIVNSEFPTQFQRYLHPKFNRWLSGLDPYTRHHSMETFFNHSNDVLERLKRWYASEWKIWSVVIVVGEIRSMKDAINLRWLSEEFKIPCICDSTSMMTSTTHTHGSGSGTGGGSDSSSSSSGSSGACVFLGVDRLLASPLFADTLAASVRVVIRIGGSIISTRTLDWMSKLPLATVIRVRDDGYETSRHDSTWIADQYLHAPLSGFIMKLAASMKEHSSLGTASMNEHSPQGTACHGKNVSSALLLLNIANEEHSKSLMHVEVGPFSEPLIALILQQQSDGQSPVYLSSSMACRDYDGFTGSAVPSYGLHGNMRRRVACNRGANGIDGVISSTAGYAYACSSVATPVTLLIGDVATLHDITGISIAAGSSPGNVGCPSLIGGGRVGKIVCISNSGGAIFSFLPAAAHRDDYFSPFLDTPHNLDLCAVATALLGPSSVLRSTRVSSAAELKIALKDQGIFFIECVGLPSHAKNVLLHKKMTQQLTDAVDDCLIHMVQSELEWTLHTPSGTHRTDHCISTGSTGAGTGAGGGSKDMGGTGEGSGGKSALLFVDSNSNRDREKEGEKDMDNHGQPLIVLLHGWMGCEEDWAAVVQELSQGSYSDLEDNHTATAAATTTAPTVLPFALSHCHILTVSSHGMIHSPSLFCHALKRIIEHDIHHVGQVILVGYSQGGRLAMHYRSMFPSTVQNLLTLSTCPGKVLSNDLEALVLNMWRNENKNHGEKKNKNANENKSNNHKSDNENENEVHHIHSPSRNFLYKWYNLPVFSNISLRHPTQLNTLIEKKLTSGVTIDQHLCNMICTSMTNDAYVDHMLLGELDTKYHNMAIKSIQEKTLKSMNVVPNCGHVLLSEATSGMVSTVIASRYPHNSNTNTNVNTNTYTNTNPNTYTYTNTNANTNTNPNLTTNMHSTTEEGVIRVRIDEVRILPFAIPMRDPLTVLSMGLETVYKSRRGVRIVMSMRALKESEDKYEYEGEGKYEGEGYHGQCKGMKVKVKGAVVSVGEIYEPVFTVPDRRQGLTAGAVVTYDTIHAEVSDLVNKLIGHVIDVTASPEEVAVACRAVAAHVGEVSTPVAFGLQQCLLHALSQVARVCLMDCMERLMIKGQGREGTKKMIDKEGKGKGEIKDRQEMRGNEMEGVVEIEDMKGKGMEGIEKMKKMRRSSHVSINGFATIRAKKPDTDTPPSTSTSASTPTRTSSSICAPTHSTVSQRGMYRRPILKLKIGNADGTGCLSDAYRVNELVAQSLSEGDGEGNGEVEGTGEGKGEGKTEDRWLRLDANQSWSVEQAVTFGNALTADAVRAIEYIEEPLHIDTHSTAHSTVHRPAHYEELCRRCSAWRFIPIALDESLVQLEEEAVRELLDSISYTRSRRRDGEDGGDGVGSREKEGGGVENREKDERGVEIREKQGKEWRVVVKPALVSLDCPFLSLPPPHEHAHEDAHAHGPRHSTVTISCTFESGLTLAYLVCIASFFDGSHGVHAKADMALECSSTQAFIQLIEDDGKGGKVVQVSKAVELIHEHSRSLYYQEHIEVEVEVEVV